ncbi:hypothetical protein CQA44_11365, partial [Helicobacter sp. MIT 14-3879]
ILLDTLKQDLRNMNEIFKIRNELRKEKIKINMESKEIESLLPQYKYLLDEKGKFIANKQSSHSITAQTQEAIDLKLVKEAKESLQAKQDSKETQHYMAILENHIKSIQNANIELRDFVGKEKIEDKIAILQQNQENILNAQRSRGVL